MSLSAYLIIFGALAILVIATVIKKPVGGFQQGLRNGGENLATMLPILPLAIITAGFIAEMIPQDAASAWIGPDAGLKGIIIASIAGGITPGGPFISFPLALAFIKAGAGVPQVIAFISGWSVIAVHRILLFEMPLLGPWFSLLRLLSALLIPTMAGIIAWGLVEIWPVSFPG